LARRPSARGARITPNQLLDQNIGNVIENFAFKMNEETSTQTPFSAPSNDLHFEHRPRQGERASPQRCDRGGAPAKSAMTCGRGEQAQAAGVLDRLGTTVRAKLGVEIADVCLDGVRRQVQLPGDFRRRQMGRQET
jgi:hypothetical protein